jgi:hypothetical protein
MPTDLNKISFIDQMHNFVRTKAQDAYFNIPKVFPGHVSKILANDFVEFTFDTVGPFTIPKVQIPQSFSKYHREPTAVGDKGLAFAADIFLGGESGQDGSTANMYPRGNLGTLTFHPISNKNWPTRDPNMFLVTAGSSGHTTQSQDTKTSLVIDSSNNITHISSNSILHQAEQNITHIAQQNITHIAQEALTHAAIGNNGIINMVVQKGLTIGAPNPSLLNDTDPPIPSLPTLVSIIGNLAANGNLSASGTISSSSGGASGNGGTLGDPIPQELVNAPVTVNGSRNGNLALASLLTGLVTLGLIVDDTTP